MTPRVPRGSVLPNFHVLWLDTLGSIIDFSSGATFTVRVAVEGSETALITKTSGITGRDAAPNVVIAWATVGELSTLAPGAYWLQVDATVGGALRRTTPMPFEIVSSLA